MGDHWLAGIPPIPITVRRSARARRISLRISRADGSVTLTVPRGVSVSEGLAFAADRETWLRRNLVEIRAVMAPASPLAFGGRIPFRGEWLTIVPAPVRLPVATERELLLPDGQDRIGARVQAFLKATARDALAEAADRHAAALGRPYGRLTLRDTRARWGSCSQRGDLMFSWRLVMAPQSVLDYVAAHEVAHLAEMNHSPAFWSVVASLIPGYESQRAWLRRNGSCLLALRFGD